MKFNIITLGCKVNTYESNFMKESLITNGFSFCEDVSICDIIIVIEFRCKTINAISHRSSNTTNNINCG